MTTRRELLTLLLGAPLAAEACRRSSPVPGRLLGASSELGHLLRDARLASNVDDGKPVTVDVAIVGSGPSGLSAAWRLDQLGLPDFQLFEMEGWLGGTSASDSSSVSAYPWGAHYVPLPGRENGALRRLLQEVSALDERGEPAENVLIREPEERIFCEGAWHEGLFPAAAASPEDLAEFRHFESLVQKWASFRDIEARRAFALPLAYSAESPELSALDQQSAAAFCQTHGLRSPRVLWYLDYCCRDDYGATLGTTSAWALLFYFVARLPQAGAPTQPFLTWPEGNGRLVRHLAERAGKRVSSGQLVYEVSPHASGVSLKVLDVASKRTRLVHARAAILAVPQFIIQRLWVPFRTAPPAYFREFKYSSWLVANLHLHGRPKEASFPMAWDNVLYSSPSVGYVVATHQALSDFGPTVLTYYLPLVNANLAEERKKLLRLDHATACDAILADLKRAHPDLRSLVDSIDVWRWGHAMVRPSVGFWSSEGRRRASVVAPNVFAAHSDLSGVALFEEAQYQGVSAAEKVAGLTQIPFKSLYG